MKWLNLCKKKEQHVSPISPQKQLQYIIDYIPEFYKDERQYISALEFLSYNEWALALESLVELANETGHYFSEDFWNRITDLAGQLNLSESKAHCLEQIQRNKRDLKARIPFGRTMIKIDETHFQSHIAEKQKDEWLTERHKKDNVKALLQKDGTYLKMHARSGTLYIIEHEKLAEVGVELGPEALILYFKATTKWTLPIKQPITEQERQKIKEMIKSWAVEKKERIDLDE